MTLGGIHHVTALAGDAQANLDFYTGFLGQQLVKWTVNYDDPGTHHFYYGDALGSPGSLLTFFPWGHVRKPRKGSGQVVAVSYAVNPTSLDEWARRGAGRWRTRFGAPVLTIADPDGLELELVGVETAGERPSPLFGVTIRENDRERAMKLYCATLGLSPCAEDGNDIRFAVPGGGFIDVEYDPAAEPGTMGAGIVHHLALRVSGDAEQLAWRERLMAAGLRVSYVKDRSYFQSVYFRPPGSTLFEIATDGPGFTLDEPAEALGTSLCLPPWLQEHRTEIAARLSEVTIPERDQIAWSRSRSGHHA